MIIRIHGGLSFFGMKRIINNELFQYVMKHRISSKVFIFDRDRILLIKHVDPISKNEWWVPPGGGVQGEETVLDAAKREVWEESGLDVEIGQLSYVRQLIFDGYNMLELYFWSNGHDGNPHIGNIAGKGEDEDFIKDCGWFSQEQVQNMRVLPSIIKDGLWLDRHNHPPARFIGLDREF